MQPLADFLSRVSPPQTPALVIRRAALGANLAALQSACDAAGVRLRAHGKMHKCSTLGRLQVAGGAVGLCCQTVGEAETYVAGGIGDVLVTAPVPLRPLTVKVPAVTVVVPLWESAAVRLRSPTPDFVRFPAPLTGFATVRVRPLLMENVPPPVPRVMPLLAVAPLVT